MTILLRVYRAQEHRAKDAAVPVSFFYGLAGQQGHRTAAGNAQRQRNRGAQK